MKQELKELAGGALQEKFNKSFERVIENMQDPNTPYKNKRQIVIKMTFEQSEDRPDAKVQIDVAEKLAPQTALTTSFVTGTDLRTKQVYAREYGAVLKGQLSMEEPPVDEETGEILEENEVLDYRKVKGE